MDHGMVYMALIMYTGPITSIMASVAVNTTTHPLRTSYLPFPHSPPRGFHYLKHVLIQQCVTFNVCMTQRESTHSLHPCLGHNK